MSRAGPKTQAAIIPKDAEIWGINSRQFHSSRLKLRMRASKLLGQDFTTSSNRHQQLRDLIPAGKIAVAESGIQKPQEIDGLVRLGYSAALIGTAFLKGPRRVADIVSAFAERIGNVTDIAHTDLAWQRTAHQ